MPEHARAFWVVTPGRGEIRSEPLQPPAEGDVHVRTLFSGISRGTESLVFNGEIPESEAQRMRAPFQAGDFPAPVKYGYCSVGRIESGPAELRGRNAFCLYPHQTEYVVPVNAVRLLPDDLPPARAVLAANMETALNGVWDARPQPGDRVAVIGAGTVGALAAWILRGIRGVEVELIDINPHRSALAAALDVPFATPDSASTGCDLILHASGSQAGLALALRLAAFEGTIVELSWYGSRPVTLPLGEAFHSQRLTLKSSQVGHVAASQRSRWDYARRMQMALRLLGDPALDALITGESAFEELPEVMARLAKGDSDTLCHRIRYS